MTPPGTKSQGTDRLSAGMNKSMPSLANAVDKERSCADASRMDGSPAKTGPGPRSKAAASGVGLPTGLRKLDVGEVEDLQILNESGDVDAKLDPKLLPQELKKIHRGMVLSRKLDQRMLTMQRQGQMGTFAPGLGQEATQIGQVYPLVKEDWFAPSYRSFGAQLWRGWPLDHLLLLWDGYFEGFGPPEGVNDLPFCIVIGSHVPTATGIAMGMRIRRDPHCVMVNFGDGASSQGIVNEAFNFAAVYQAPVVFMLENNGWAISMPATKQVATEAYAVRGIGFGIPSVRVDGNDVLAVLVATQKACERARSGGGPTLIEAMTYRMSVHTTADDPKVYRDDAEVKEWELRDPIRRFEIYLKNKKVLDDAAIARIHEECEQEVLAARDKFRARAKARPREVFDFVYANPSAEHEAQKREYLTKLDKKKVD